MRAPRYSGAAAQPKQKKILLRRRVSGRIFQARKVFSASENLHRKMYWFPQISGRRSAAVAAIKTNAAAASRYRFIGLVLPVGLGCV